MDISVAHRYWHIQENLLPLNYGALGVKLTEMIEVRDSCAGSKVKSRTVSKKTYIKDKKPGEIFFVDTTGPFPENFIGNCY